MELRSGYKQTEVGEIPEDWNVDPLDSFAKVSSGKRLPMGYYVSSVVTPHPYIRVVDMRSGGVDTSDLKYVPVAAFPPIKNFRIYKDELFISVAGTLGVVGKILPELDGANLTENANRISDIACDTDFLLHVMLSPIVQDVIASEQTVGAQPKLALARIRKFKIPKPRSEAEQSAIATTLSDVDALLATQDALIAKKRAMKQGAMQELLTGKLRLPGFGGGWILSNLTSVLSRVSTGLNPRQNFRLNDGGACYYVTIKNFSNGELRLDDDCDLVDEVALARINERSDLKKDDILFSSIGRIGDVFLVPETPKNWNINESVFTLRPNKKVVSPLFLFHALMSDQVKNEIGKVASGSTFTGIKQAHLKAIQLQIPPSIDEQSAIAAVLKDFDAEIFRLEINREKTTLIKQGMTQALLTGRIRLV